MNRKMSAFVSQGSPTVFPPAGGKTDWIQSLSSNETSKASEQSKRVSVSNDGDHRSRKRKAFHEKENPSKRQRTSEPLEDTTRLRVKLFSDTNSSSKRQRGSNPEEASQESIESSLESPKKRKKSTKATFGGTNREEFEAKYEQLNLLGAGSFGAVYAGYRREDRFPVALKYISREDIIFEGITENSKTLPLEVTIMLKLACGQELGKSAIISLLDFYDFGQNIVLIMERPVPGADLVDHIKNKGGVLQEEESKLILKQLVGAAMELQAKRVFHRDIKAENILIETSTDVPRAKLIDFGLSCLTKKSSTYKVFYGTSAQTPPEWYQRGFYRPGPTTVWQLGAVLYDMLHMENRFETKRYLNKDISISKDLSPECQEMLNLLLAEDPHQRLSLGRLSCHPWLA